MGDLKTVMKKFRLNEVFNLLKKSYFLIASPFAHKVIDTDTAAARKCLREFYEGAAGSCLGENELNEPFEYDLQVIVPAYNVGEYLKECVDSVLTQETEYKIQVVIVDDGSTDSTPEIADSYSADPRVRVIHQENRGLSNARNRGLEKINAGYIAFMDSDDVMVQGAVQAMMEAAYEKDADIVEGGYNVLENGVLIKLPNVNEIKPVDKFYKGYCGGKVYRSCLWKNIRFPEGFWFGDSVNSFLIFPQAKKAYRIPDYVYTYRTRLTGITGTSRVNPKCVDTFYVTELLIKERDKLDLPKDKAYYDKILSQFLLNGQRVLNLPEDVQRSIFILTSGLLKENFEPDKFGRSHRKFKNALEKSDYGVYKLYCRTH